ncbi:site-2 protease family protein [bacterium]|nr:site-2 protease family protein [bacterium]
MLTANLEIIAAQIIVLLFAIVFHEVAHGWVASRLGDQTARQLGRLTLNPLPHIDPMFSIVMPIITTVTLGFPFGGAKPVPINPYNLGRPRRDMALVAAAGPLSNLLLALVAGLIFRVVAGFAVSHFLLILLQMAVIINLMLAGFNLLPIPPLDGSRVVAYFLPPELEAKWRALDRFGIIIILVLFIFADEVLMRVIFSFIRFFTHLFTGMSFI